MLTRKIPISQKAGWVYQPRHLNGRDILAMTQFLAAWLKLNHNLRRDTEHWVISWPRKSSNPRYLEVKCWPRPYFSAFEKSKTISQGTQLIWFCASDSSPHGIFRFIMSEMAIKPLSQKKILCKAEGPKYFLGNTSFTSKIFRDGLWSQ